MFRSVMNLQLISEALCLLGVVPFVEGGNLMSVEVVHDKDYFVRLRVAFDQFLRLCLLPFGTLAYRLGAIRREAQHTRKCCKCHCAYIPNQLSCRFSAAWGEVHVSHLNN